MTRLPELSVDNMTADDEDTSEAIKYFEKKHYEFDCYKEVEDKKEDEEEDEDEEVSLEILNKELKYTVYLSPYKYPLEEEERVATPYTSQKLQTLIKEVEANASLFSQLEHLMRYYPVDQVLDCDIKLIVQNLLYWTNAQCEPVIGDNRLVMGNDTNLARLGLVAQILKVHKHAFILSNAKTVVACYLFMELCHKVGLENVELLFSRTLKTEETYPGNCVGVITENADIDSAVDVLMESSSMSSWRLARLLVQESVYNTFKQALQWKTRKSSSHQLDISDYKSKCAEVYAYKGKVLLIDYAGDISVNNNIRVEAYRTTKELLSLVADGKHYFMSLWSDSLSESNEIAYNDTTPNLVWINAFGVVGGPAQSSQPFYEHIHDVDIIVSVNKMEVEKQLKWSRLPFDHRLNLIISTLKEMAHPAVNQFVEAGLVNWNRRDVIYVNSGKMCVCSTKNHAFTLHSKVCVQILRDLAIGTAVIIGYNYSKVTNLEGLNDSMLEKLINVGAPIVLTEDPEAPLVSVAAVMGEGGYTKVVWSNYGTIFAN